jgi:ferredoxin
LVEKGIHLEVDEDLCVACGLCEARVPENLAIDDEENSAHVIKQPVGEVENEGCIEAVDYCPTGGLKAELAGATKNAA